MSCTAWSGMSRLRAVVVGIETYAAGPDWNLNGAALDACRIVQWLREHDVPSPDITVLASALPENAAAVAGLGVPVRRADKGTIYDLFTGELRDDAADELFVYWGGHGVVDQHGQRRLFCSDATREDKRNLTIDGLQAFLSTNYFQGFNRQSFLVDACQVRSADRRYVYGLPADGWPDGPRRPGRQQHLLFAASSGEAAAHLTNQRTGLFTREALARLKHTGTGPLQLDVAALSAALDEKFTNLRANGESEQTPFYTWLHTPQQEGVVFGLPAAQTHHPLSLRALADLLNVMLLSDELVDAPRRQQMVLLMPNEVRATVSYAAEPRPHLLSWIRSCEQFETGRESLVAVLEMCLSDRRALTRILAVLDRVWPR